MTTIAEINTRMLAERIVNAGHSEAQLKATAAIVKACKSIIDKVQWSLDPEESAEDRAYWMRNMIEEAHELVDLAHEFKQAIQHAKAE